MRCEGGCAVAIGGGFEKLFTNGRRRLGLRPPQQAAARGSPLGATIMSEKVRRFGPAASQFNKTCESSGAAAPDSVTDDDDRDPLIIVTDHGCLTCTLPNHADNRSYWPAVKKSIRLGGLAVLGILFESWR